MADSLIKKAHIDDNFTPEQILEVQRCALDPVYFAMNYIRIQHPLRGSIPLQLRDYQIEALRAFEANRFCIMLASRQTGKSLTIAIYILWFACFREDKSIVVASNKNSNAMEIIHRIKYAYEEMPMWLKPGCVYNTKHSIEFDNGSRIWSEATTEDTARGKSVSLLMCDELAFVKKGIQDAFWTSVLPTLSTGGSALISSTPNGDNDLFAQLWRGAEMDTNGFHPIRVHWRQRDDINHDAFEAEMRKKFDDLTWRVEFELEFLSSEATAVDQIALKRQVAEVPSDIIKDFSIWGRFDPRKTYLVGSDVATGSGKDYSTIEVFELESLRQMAEYRSNKIKEHQLYTAIKFIVKHIVDNQDKQTGKRPKVYWSFENNAVGRAIVNLYLRDAKFEEELEKLFNGKLEDSPELISDDGKTGFTTGHRTKVEAVKTMKNLLEKIKGGFELKSKFLIAELKEYIQKGNSYEAKDGATDDLVSATLIVCRIIHKIMEYDDDIFTKVMNPDEDFIDTDGEFGEDPLPFI